MFWHVEQQVHLKMSFYNTFDKRKIMKKEIHDPNFFCPLYVHIYKNQYTNFLKVVLKTLALLSNVGRCSRRHSDNARRVRTISSYSFNFSSSVIFIWNITDHRDNMCQYKLKASLTTEYWKNQQWSCNDNKIWWNSEKINE